MIVFVLMMSVELCSPSEPGARWSQRTRFRIFSRVFAESSQASFLLCSLPNRNPTKKGNLATTNSFQLARHAAKSVRGFICVTMDPERVRGYLQVACAGLGFDIGEIWWTQNESGTSTLATIGECSPFYFRA